jgi:uncharacterized ubiquitin-like protein YukD
VILTAYNKDKYDLRSTNGHRVRKIILFGNGSQQAPFALIQKYFQASLKLKIQLHVNSWIF